MEKLLKLVSKENIETAKNGRKYITTTFRPVSMWGNVSVLSNQKPITRVLWDALTDKEGRDFPADGLFTALSTGELAIGGFVEGQVVRVNTTPYDLNGRQATSFTCVVFSNEDLITYVNRQLRANKAVMVDSDGNLTSELPKENVAEEQTA